MPAMEDGPTTEAKPEKATNNLAGETSRHGQQNRSRRI